MKHKEIFYTKEEQLVIHYTLSQCLHCEKPALIHLLVVPDALFDRNFELIIERKNCDCKIRIDDLIEELD